MWGKLDGKLAREHHQSRFADAVVGVAADRALSADVGQVDDAGCWRGAQQRQQRLGQEEGSFEVDRLHGAVLLAGDRLVGDALKDACVVDDHIEGRRHRAHGCSDVLYALGGG